MGGNTQSKSPQEIIAGYDVDHARSVLADFERAEARWDREIFPVYFADVTQFNRTYADYPHLSLKNIDTYIRLIQARLRSLLATTVEGNPDPPHHPTHPDIPNPDRVNFPPGYYGEHTSGGPASDLVGNLWDALRMVWEHPWRLPVALFQIVTALVGFTVWDFSDLTRLLEQWDGSVWGLLRNGDLIWRILITALWVGGLLFSVPGLWLLYEWGQALVNAVWVLFGGLRESLTVGFDLVEQLTHTAAGWIPSLDH